MLQQMRKHMTWMMWLIVGLITVTFLFFGIYPSMSGGSTAAKVNGDIISQDELNRVYQNMSENYRQILKDQFNESFAKVLKRQALQELIRNRLLIQEAGRVGVRVSDEELQAYLMKIQAFSVQGKFDKRVYERALQNINMTPAAFEENQRGFLLSQKFEHLIEDAVVVTDAELPAAYAAKNPKAKPADFAKNKDTFRQSHIAEKKREALDAFVKNLENKASIKITGQSPAS